ncbi:MAG: hypothetical protein ACUVX8_18335 [Candidatus Zipacnadales bacterium]
MDKEGKAPPTNFLVDTGVFISWHRGEKVAQDFFRHPPGRLYYSSKQTRKELLHPPISDMESRTVKRFLRRFRAVNPDALIAATAWAKKMTLVTPNPRQFKPIKEIRVAIFPAEFVGRARSGSW